MAEEQAVASYQDILKQSLREETNPQQAVAPVETPPTNPATEVIQPEYDEPSKSPFDPIAWFKKEISDDVDSIEAIKQKLNKPAPEPVYKEPEFTNEESKRIYEAIVAGKENEVAEYFEKKKLVSSLKDKTPEDLVKEGWKNEFNLTDAQAQKRFEKMFGVDDLLEDDEKEIEQKIKAKEIEKEANRYKDYFAQYETEIKLPSLDKPAPANAQPEITEEARKADLYAAELTKGLPQDVNKIGYAFADDKSDYKLSGQIELTDEEIDKVTAPLTGYEDRYLANRWFGQDGQPNDKLIKSDIYFMQNRTELINKIVADVVHQTRIEEQKRSRNYKAPGELIQGDFTKSEDELKKEHYRKYFM